ncbi:MAG TPA: hypothetical protein VL282_08635 [Tepidisphaeraceae bacterium]|jgi:hypothetical protein|nr:hypothetical protein [Tepidisphaeraceae bacterium]
MSTPTPKSIGCPTKRALIDHLDKAHHWAVELAERELLLAMHGHIDLIEGLEQPLQAANENRNAAIRALREHVATHGC